MHRILMSLLLLLAWGSNVPVSSASSLDSFANLMPKQTESQEAPGSLKVTFLGVSTLLFDDGETALLTDGFFTRPNLLTMAKGKISPNKKIISHSLERAGIKKLAAILVTHSHYDHAMDAAVVAMQTGAMVLGSESTANIARGGGVPEDRIKVVRDDQTVTFGRFEVTFIHSQHSHPNMAAGEIEKPLVPPAFITQYHEGGSYALVIKHDGKSILVQSSAGIAPGALKGRKADVAFLSIGTLGKQKRSEMNQYWDEVVKEVGAKRLIPIHWDNFSKPLDEPLVPIPWPLEDFPKAIKFLQKRSLKEGIDLRIAPAWTRFDPFAGIEKKH